MAKTFRITISNGFIRLADVSVTSYPLNDLPALVQTIVGSVTGHDLEWSAIEDEFQTALSTGGDWFRVDEKLVNFYYI